MNRLREIGGVRLRRSCEERHYVTTLAVPPAVESRLCIPPFWRDFGGIRPRRGSEIDHSSSRSAQRATIAAMPRRARVVTSNRQGNPPELRELSAGRYVVEPVQEEALMLTPEEEAGIEATLQSYRRGRVVDAKRAREVIDSALRR
jgi:hypothetical protein